MNIKDTEDFDNEPGENMKKMLRQMKNNDCDTYLILISNGIQMKSLLRFGDRFVFQFNTSFYAYLNCTIFIIKKSTLEHSS